jgi:hypothetical protein
MFRVMLDNYGPVMCRTTDDDLGDMEPLGRLETREFYSHIPAEWLAEVEGAANGCCNNL